MMTVVGCGSPAIVNTGEAWTPIGTPASPAQLPQYSTNHQLADAAEFYTIVGAQKAYRFAAPSGRWHCVIVPHESAGCQRATASPLSITGAPTSVIGPDGAPATPNTIIIDRSSDVRFTEVVPDAGAASPAPIVTLPFGKVLVVAGFRCNVQEVSGVSCGSESSGMGFTFSADGYTGVYTDVPR